MEFLALVRFPNKGSDFGKHCEQVSQLQGLLCHAKVLGEKDETHLPKQAGPWIIRTLESQCLCSKPR